MLKSPPVFVVRTFCRELALRFAERGIRAVAIDYFGRTAGIGKRDDDFDYMEHVRQGTPEGMRADVGAAVAHLRASGVPARCEKSGTTGRTAVSLKPSALNSRRLNSETPIRRNSFLPAGGEAGTSLAAGALAPLATGSVAAVSIQVFGLTSRRQPVTLTMSTVLGAAA